MAPKMVKVPQRLRIEVIFDLNYKWLGVIIQILNSDAQPSPIQNGQTKPVFELRKKPASIEEGATMRIKIREWCQMVNIAPNPPF